MAHDVFISYSVQDKVVADAVCAILEGRKIPCWIAPRDLLPGVPYAGALIDALNESRVLILVFSSASNDSPHVAREVERAVSKRIPIVPLRIEDVPPSKAMEYCISAHHWLDALTPPLEKHLQRLADAVQHLLSPEREEQRLPVADQAAVRLQRLMPREFAERLLATRGHVADERRVVTILFSDLKGSIPMAEELDPEEWMEIMDGAFDVLIGPITHYEGMLARLAGDRILAFFGAPIAHEDDAERACRAALDIIAGAEEYAARLEEERDISGFSVRVGIHTGLVVTGEVGSDLRVEYTAMGDAVNLASRMEGLAEPGTVLITEETHRLIAPLFETEALGSMRVRGRTEPVPVYRILAPRAAVGKPRGIVGLESPMVGREAEFGALQGALQLLQAGVGGIVTVVGEAGVGKSRLVAELRKEAEPLGLQWVEGRCLSYGTSVPYLLWLDVLRGLLGVTAEDSLASVQQVLRQRAQHLCPDSFESVYPYLARLMSLPLDAQDEAVLQGVLGERLKANTFRAMETLLECSPSDGPLALVCEDLHWADPTSMELLEHLFGLSDRAPLLLICVFRPYREHVCWQAREKAARLYHHRHTDLWLEPLTTAESAALVGNLLRIETLAPRLRERILRHAEGNPFYVEEILRSLIDSGVIVRDETAGRWQAAQELEDIAIPDTLQGVLMARMDRLQEEARRVLQLASVIGRIFLYRVLAAIAQAERARPEQTHPEPSRRGRRELDAHLLTLQREEMIREGARVPELEYIFKHELTREAAYNGLLRRERRYFHRQVAEALEDLLADRIEEQVDLLAHHWEWAEEPWKAIHYLQQAGDRAARLSANQEAVAHYTRALEFLGTLPESTERDQQELALQLASVVPITATRSWGDPEAGRACARARELCQKLGDAPQLFPAMIWTDFYSVSHAEHQAARELGERIMNLAERAQDPLQIMMAHQVLGTSSVFLGELQEAKAHLEQVMVSYDLQEHGTLGFQYGQDPAVVSLSFTVYALWLLGYPEQGLQLSQEMVALARELDHPFSLSVFALAFAGRLHRWCHEVQPVQDIAEEVTQIGVEKGMPLGQAEGAMERAWVVSEQGNPEEATALYRQGLDAWRATGMEVHVPEFLSVLAGMYAKTGQVDEALSAIGEAVSQVERTDERYWEAEVHRIKGELLRMKGVDEAEVERHFQRAIDVARRRSAKSLELRASMSLCRLWQRQGKVDEAWEMLAKIYGWFTEGFDTGDLKEARALLEELSGG
jgi:class 3 adenylate cyclase/predicted ATPase